MIIEICIKYYHHSYSYYGLEESEWTDVNGGAERTSRKISTRLHKEEHSAPDREKGKNNRYTALIKIITK